MGDDINRLTPKAHGLAVGLTLLVACAAFFPGINWGLPSRANDRYLFGDRTPWSGAQIVQLAPAESALGADVDANPIAQRDRVVVLNDTDAKRAEIVRRYRLFSNQPDEMITFKALSRIREFHGDPRLYQYGGLWTYPVGGIIRLALRPNANLAYNLDHPEGFARFYVAARVYSAIWGLIAVAAIVHILYRLTGDNVVAAAGGCAFALMPVVVNAAHEAKPHLAGLALTLLAVIAAGHYVRTGAPRSATLAGVLCGAALAMVLSSLVAFVILPVMMMMRGRRVLGIVSVIIWGLVVYFAFNPFVLVNLIAHREILRSNLGNSTAMYRISASGATHALRLILEGASPVLVLAAIIGAVSLMRNARATPGASAAPRPPVRPEVWLLLAPAALVAIQFVLLAAGKPPEYARFGLLLDALLLVVAFCGCAEFAARGARRVAAIALFACIAPFGTLYTIAFVRDVGPQTRRLDAAAQLQVLVRDGATRIVVPAEPAPYVMPPPDLFRTRLLLVPPGQRVDADVIVELAPEESYAPISWADARFRIIVPPRPARATVSSPP